MSLALMLVWGAMVPLLLTVLFTAYRLFVGPGDANRAAASDLLFFSVIALFSLLGVAIGLDDLFDVVLVATLVGFLAALSLARAMLRGRR